MFRRSDIPAPVKSDRPKAVIHAEWALWAWTAWICLFGIYQSLTGLSGADADLIAQYQAMTRISFADLRPIMIAGYVLVAVSMALVVAQIGAGKRWARISLAISFVLEALWVLATGTGVADYLPSIPDFGLQIYALYLLYTPPGRDWFAKKPRSAFG